MESNSRLVYAAAVTTLQATIAFVVEIRDSWKAKREEVSGRNPSYNLHLTSQQ